MAKTRVIVVDDSITVRKQLCEALGRDPQIEVVAEADDGKRAFELCRSLRPDVMTMDMMMPVMSGVAATEQIMAHCPTPILIVSASTNRGELFKTYEALAAGAVDVLEKPRGDEPDGHWEKNFIGTVKLISRIRVITHPRARLGAMGVAQNSQPPATSFATPSPHRYELAAIGASTGGPGALVDILRSLPTNFRLPTILVLHINEPFGSAFAEWLDSQSTHRVSYARHGESVAQIGPRVVMAPPDSHLVVRDGRLHLNKDAERHSCRPSVDVLFESIARECANTTAACLLTGMGRDGASGLLEIRKAGGFTIAQNEATSIVYGMPREAVLLNAATRVLPLGEIGPVLGSLALESSGGSDMNANALIVDDSLTVRMDLAEAFEAAGFHALPCACVAEARAALRDSVISVVVLDVLLPDGDGVDLLSEIRTSAAGAGMVILMLSSEADVKDRIRGLQTGADEYVGKPYDSVYVTSKARELLRARQSDSQISQPSILVIDDSETYRQELKSALEQAGYSVLTAGSGEEGLRIAADRRPTALVVDGMMPGIDGPTVIRRVRLDAALRGMPCLLLTASEDSGDELRALDAGADAFVRKDDDIEIVLAKLAVALRRPGVATTEETVSLAGPRKLLAVDDSPTYLNELAGKLREEGYEVILAHTGEEALDLLAVQAVDCVLLDLMMPGIGGTETCRRIKEAPIVREIPLIMLTALEDRSAMLEGLSAGADDYIAKSSEFDVLKARVRAQLRRKQFEDEHRRIREELLRSELQASEARGARNVAETKAALAEELQRKNKELEAFSYSVSHDLRAPLRAIDGFSQALLEDYSPLLDDRGRNYLVRVRAATQRMAELIDDLLQLSRVSRAELVRHSAKISEIAKSVAEDLQRKEPEREVTFSIRDDLVAEADSRLVRVVLENLIGNAWKFTSKTASAHIELGATERDGETEFFVHDNGAGFSMTYAEKLFSPFQRLHSDAEFPGTGIGLATVHRIIDRHGGMVRAEGVVGSGATISFTLPTGRNGGGK